MYQAVFSDIDGTLLNSAHQMTEKTRRTLARLEDRGIPFTLVSARSPQGIASIRRLYGLSGPLIAFSGGLILEEDGSVIHSQGMDGATARGIIRFAEAQGFDCAWCLYSAREWLVRDRMDPRIRAEEEIVDCLSSNADPACIPDDGVYYKVMMISAPPAQPAMVQALRARFPHLSVMPSNDINLEITLTGISKGLAVQKLCQSRGIDPLNAIAFGDHYNDQNMLEAVGCPIAMGNAPADMRARFVHVTADNDHDGVALALEKLIFAQG